MLLNILREKLVIKSLSPLVISGREVLPLVEGGKGISVSNGESSGSWAAAGGVGTFSAVNADALDERGELIPVVYHGKTRRERHDDCIVVGEAATRGMLPWACTGKTRAGAAAYL